jgi:signal transduction histidine kinase
MSYLQHPPLLDEVGLASALRCYLDGVAKRSRIEISLDIQPHKFPRLPRSVETAIFRIDQETLTNVFRHSEDDVVHLEYTINEEQLRARVSASLERLKTLGQVIPDS